MHGCSILFSAKDEWEAGIRRKLQGYRLTFADFDTVDLAAFDLVVPLNLPDEKRINRARSHGRTPRALVPSDACIDLCNDKVRFHGFMQDIGLAHLVPGIGASIPFPYILKPRIGAWGVGTMVIMDSENEATQASQQETGNRFRQAYVRGREEFASHLIVNDGEIVFRRSVKHFFDTDVYVKGAGTPPTATVTVDHTGFSNVFHDILRAMDYRGICCIDYKIVDGQPVILEINPRYGASMTRFIDEAIPVYRREVSRIGEHPGAMPPSPPSPGVRQEIADSPRDRRSG